MKGKAASLRRTVRLATGYRLRANRAGSEYSLISPQGSIVLNDTAAAILDLCNGSYSHEELLAQALRTREELRADDARAFLEAARHRGWIVDR